ncbi:C40 family peptidase [Xanthovirga aplysinae]|uniref:C40 family peptidase n=1 Tax=Xanthovirga aplysinae TaxID=2529853 RepID=UPI0012BD4C04|nr:C40 family peptidase [Xanthovirga aplysinae]MTI33289.1 hypothetical protein [Xanthovirga aplysinae]
MYHKGICQLSVAPVRTHPADAAEMSTQLLFGDTFEVIEVSSDEKWLKICIDFDKYEGWIDTKQGIPSSDFIESEAYVLTDYFSSLVLPNGPQNIVLGSVLHFSNPALIEEINELEKNKSIKKMQEKKAWSYMEDTAFKYLNAPYLWGGKTPFGIDCSGLTQQVFKIGGYALKRDAWQQAEQGQVVEDLDLLKAGDLAFFHNDKGKIVHVGMMLSTGDILHASGKVRIDRLDEKGIFNDELKAHSHQLAFVKRILSNNF